MTKRPLHVNKTVYVADTRVWDEATRHAKKLNLTQSQMVMQALAQFAKSAESEIPCQRCEQIRQLLTPPTTT